MKVLNEREDSTIAHRMESAIRHWLRPCFGGEGKPWVNEKTIFYRKELAFKAMTAWDFDNKDRVVCRRKGYDENREWAINNWNNRVAEGVAK